MGGNLSQSTRILGGRIGMCSGRVRGMTRLALATLLAASLPCLSLAADSPALDLARQLNNAFIEVAEKVSPAVVVIKVARTQRASALDDSDNPFWDLVPKEFRRQFEEEREKRRREESEEEKPNRPPVFDGQGSGVIIRDGPRFAAGDGGDVEGAFRDVDPDVAVHA